ncbi:MAG: hypothetical protein IH921_04015 [Gemmatimonadetes bacterium]|nr:hypothetical protein [Gemmatimonadota bacterium]
MMVTPPRLFTINPGQPFLDTLATGILDESGGDRMALAGYIVLLPNRRACSALADAFLRAVGRADIVLVSGGLGPTRDDLTIQVLASSFGRKLVLDEDSLAKIHSFFQRLGREMTENNASQAWFPDGTDVLDNPIGTAPGCLIEEQGTLVFCMPGVPRELYKMMDEQVLPRIAARGQAGGTVVRARLLRTFGTGSTSFACDPCLTSSAKIRRMFRDAGVGVSSLATSICFDAPIRPRIIGRVFGDQEQAVEYYNALVGLWEQADPELQPQVADLRNRIARLVGEGR